MTKLVIISGEETVSFTLLFEDGTEQRITNLNHDDHGWQCMQSTGTALEKLATSLGVTIEHRDINDLEAGTDEFGS